MRRLPIYFLIDNSESMVGRAVDAKKCLDTVVTSLQKNYLCLETVYVSVITFNNIANELIPLTDLVSFQMKEIITSGVASIDVGLNLLSVCIKSDVIKKSEKLKGDWEPIVFLMTNSNLMNNQNFQYNLNKFNSEIKCNLIVCKYSDGAEVSLSNNIYYEVLELSQKNNEDFKVHIKWKNQDGNIEHSLANDWNFNFVYVNSLYILADLIILILLIFKII